jgi:hypothetical protein
MQYGEWYLLKSLYLYIIQLVIKIKRIIKLI